MSDDDGLRGDHGIVVSVRDRGSEGTRIAFDRVRREGQRWVQVGFVTSREMTAKELEDMAFTDEELGEIGLVIAAELRAALEVHGTKARE